MIPSLIQGEVCIQCTQLSQEIGAQISSIQEEVGDQDDLMLPSCKENENEGSRGHGKQFTRLSYDKGKGKEVRFATESNSEPDDSGSDKDVKNK